MNEDRIVMSSLIISVVVFVLYRYIVQRCRELRSFEERGIPEPRPGPEENFR